MVVLTFVKDTYSSQTLFILLIFIFENYRGASECEEVIYYRWYLFCRGVSWVKAELTHPNKSWTSLLELPFPFEQLFWILWGTSKALKAIGLVQTCSQLGFPCCVWYLRSWVLTAEFCRHFYWKNIVLLRLEILKIQHLFILQEKAQTQMTFTNNYRNML